MAVNDNDEVGQENLRLQPSDKYILEYAKAHPDMTFCWREFSPKYAHGTIRNSFSKLSGKYLLDLAFRTGEAYYWLHKPNRKHVSDLVTLTHMGGRYNVKQLRIEDYEKYLDSLGWDELWKVHDVTLCFSCKGFYEKVIKAGKYPVNSNSKEILFSTFDWIQCRRLKVVLHRTGTIICYLKCSSFPIEVSLSGLVDLTSFLGKVQTRLEDYLSNTDSSNVKALLPAISTWIVTQWHYGKDGKRELSGKSFHATYKTWSGALVRIYLKRSGKKYRPREEVIEQPRKTLPRAFAEKEGFTQICSNKKEGVRKC